MPHAIAASEEFRNSYAEEKRSEDQTMEGLEVPNAGQSGQGKLSEGCEPALKDGRYEAEGQGKAWTVTYR